MKVFERRRQRKQAIASRTVRRQRAKPEVQRDKHPNDWQSTWGQSIKRLASIEGGRLSRLEMANFFAEDFACLIKHIANLSLCV